MLSALLVIIFIEAYDYDDLYCRLFQKCPNLIEIKASNVTDRSLGVLKATSGSELIVADLTAANPYDITKSCFKSFISNCTKLESLVLSGELDCVSEATIEDIANHCPLIEKLTLSYGVEITDLSVPYLLSLPHLLELDIMCCFGLTITGVLNLVQSIPNIESLCVDFGAKTDKDPDPIIIFQSIGRLCPRLRVLKISSLACSVYDDGSVMPVFAGCPLLEEFEAQLEDEQSPNDQVLYALGSSCPRLKTVELGYREADFTDHGLIALSRGCPDLTDLSLHNAPNVSDSAILSFAMHCLKLESIHIENNNTITSHAVCALLEANPRITSIVLGGDRFLTEDVLLSLAHHYRKLTYLKLIGCRNLTEAMLSTLFTRCTRLEKLQIENLSFETVEIVSDALVESLLLHCKRLAFISIDGCPNVTELGLAHLLRLGKRLTWVYIYNCSLNMRDELSRYYDVVKSGPTANKPYACLTRTHWSAGWTAPLVDY